MKLRQARKIAQEAYRYLPNQITAARMVLIRSSKRDYSKPEGAWSRDNELNRRAYLIHEQMVYLGAEMESVKP